jgi:hypothetical protein
MQRPTHSNSAQNITTNAVPNTTACQTAGENGVDIAGGASTVRQALIAGVIDERAAPGQRARALDGPGGPGGPGELAALLMELAKQLDSGRVYDRHLPEITVAVDEVGRSAGR